MQLREMHLREMQIHQMETTMLDEVLLTEQLRRLLGPEISLIIIIITLILKRNLSVLQNALRLKTVVVKNAVEDAVVEPLVSKS
jgi:hypothetical protein